MDNNHLLGALELLVEDSGGWCQKSDLVTLESRLPAPYIKDPGPKDRIVLAIRYILQSEWNMLTCVQRLEWTRVTANSEAYMADNWPNYASSDIEYWHVSFRSLLDYVAFALRLIAGEVLRYPTEASFRKLYQKCLAGTPGALGRLTANGLDPVKLVQSANWFGQLRCVRDSIVHKGGHTLVFGGASDGILFQVYGGSQQNLVANEPWMLNQNVAYFDRYAAHLMSHLIVFLEKFASIAAQNLGMFPLQKCDAKICHDGFAVFKAWIDSAISIAGQ